jgi:hypothetical protein
MIWLDDNGQVYINGTQIVDDNGSGGSSYDLTLDPSLFRVGQNLIAIHGVDKFTPYHTVGMELTLTVPEPSSGVLVAGLGGAAILRFHRTNRRGRQRKPRTFATEADSNHKVAYETDTPLFFSRFTTRHLHLGKRSPKEKCAPSAPTSRRY